MTDPTPEDDSTVDNGLLLYRWVSPEHIRVTEHGPELREAAFKNFPRRDLKKVSIVLDDTLRRCGRTPGSLIEGRVGFGLVALTAGEVREERQRVLRSPTSEEPAHGDVWGDKPGAVQRRLAAKARWVVRPGV